MIFMRQCVVNVTEIRQFWWDFVKAALFLQIIKSPFWLYPSFWWFKVCMECAEKYCASCFKSFHQKGALKKHTSQSVDQVGVIIWIIIHMQKFHHADWLRAHQLIPNSAESWNWVQKLETKLIDRKVTKEKLTDGQSNLLFSNQAYPWMVQFTAQFFPDCVMRVRSFCSTISKFLHVYH